MGWIYVLNTHPLPNCWYRVPLCQNFDSWLGDIPWAIARDVAWSSQKQGQRTPFLVGALEPWNFMTFHSVGINGL